MYGSISYSIRIMNFVGITLLLVESHGKEPCNTVHPLCCDLKDLHAPQALIRRLELWNNIIISAACVRER